MEMSRKYKLSQKFSPDKIDQHEKKQKTKQKSTDLIFVFLR